MKRALLLAASAAGAVLTTGFSALAADPMAGMHMAPMPALYAGIPDKPGAPLFKGLGAHRHPISTRNARAQLYFDQGVNLLFGFNHAEAIRSLREAARLDPKCAMCWWGVAVALGPNINLPMPADAVAPANEALARAQALKAGASPEERAWIDALAVRYSADPKADRATLDAAYAEAMGRLARAWPDDLDAGVFWVEAMMDTQPWDYWQADGRTPKGHGAEIVATLEAVLKKAPDHPGALHLYIHAVEASTTPERAEAAADRLLVLMPGAGHVVHMPSHIYYRVGRYADSVKANELAAKVDEDYIAACKAQGFYPLAYYGHNIHFLWTSSEMMGRYQSAIDAARRLVRATNAEQAGESMPLGELYALTPVATLLRFGKWEAILAEPAPPAQLTLDTAIWRYARGFAHANLGDTAAAAQDKVELAKLITADYSRYDGAGMPAARMVSMSLDLLDGEIARKKGDITAAVGYFKAATDLERSLPYTEPPYWHQPVSHLLGAALMEGHRAAEAEDVYRDSLKFYRDDGWALFGLAKALDAQGKVAEAGAVRGDFAKAWSMADVKLTDSRF
jgi:tetratricopeptide (TPR) repeat protein